MNYNKAEFVTSYGKFSQIPKSDRLEFAFSGRSNVGKSSLINKLLNRKNLARVSGVPGKTVTINFFSLENIYIVDLPGYGYASVSKSEKAKWGDLIGGYLGDGDRELALVFQLIDMRHPPSKDDLQMIDYLIDCEIPFVIIFTKADKLKPMARKVRMEAFRTEIPCFEDITCVPFSTVTGEGVEEIRAIIEDISEGAESIPPEERDETDLDDDFVSKAEVGAEDVNDDIPPKPFSGFLTPNGRK
ncbi:MAG: ribosome biogenesis GTP-binding protein YihA/YsxC [Ruminococcus sp.]|nr:ribosome biogenesis GTP-binding protein YihA/YsxC [Ruminococcus sp.]